MLSKSRITKSIRCPKALWLQVHKPDQSAVSLATQYCYGLQTALLLTVLLNLFSNRQEIASPAAAGSQ